MNSCVGKLISIVVPLRKSVWTVRYVLAFGLRLFTHVGERIPAPLHVRVHVCIARKNPFGEIGSLST